MFCPIIPFEGFSDPFAWTSDRAMAKSCEFYRISFAGQNGIQYPHSAQAGDVAQDVVQLEIHLAESLLHMHACVQLPFERGSPDVAIVNGQRRSGQAAESSLLAAQPNADTGSTGSRRRRSCGRERSSHAVH